MPHPNSLANLRPRAPDKLNAKPVQMRLSQPTREALDAIALLHGTNRTVEVERLPELWLLLAECAEVLSDGASARASVGTRYSRLLDALIKTDAVKAAKLIRQQTTQEK